MSGFANAVSGKGFGTAPGCGSGGMPGGSIAFVGVGAGVGAGGGTDAGPYGWADPVCAGPDAPGLAKGYPFEGVAVLVAGVNVLRPEDLIVCGVIPFAFAGEIGLSVCRGIPDIVHKIMRVSQFEV